MIDRCLNGLKRHIKTWPWTQTFVAVVLALVVLYVVWPFVAAATVLPAPSDAHMDDIREMLNIVVPSAVLLAVGKRATTKVEVMEFEARTQTPEDG